MSFANVTVLIEDSLDDNGRDKRWMYVLELGA